MWPLGCGAIYGISALKTWYAADWPSTAPVTSDLAEPSSRTSARSDWTSTTSSPWRKAARTPITGRTNYENLIYKLTLARRQLRGVYKDRVGPDYTRRSSSGRTAVPMILQPGVQGAKCDHKGLDLLGAESVVGTENTCNWLRRGHLPWQEFACSLFVLPAHELFLLTL